MQLAQLLKNCPPSIFEDYDRERAEDTCEGIVMQFTKSKGYLTVQATEEGYFYIFYDSDLHEIHSNDYDDPKVSVQKATYEILKSERMDDMECVKVDYKEFEAMTIQHSKDLLQAGELRATSEIGRDEAALNGLSRAEVERGVLYHAQGILEDMGLENEVELLAARVHGSRSREELYRDDSDLDVVLSYRGNIREDSFFNELNAHGIAMAGIKVDINPIAEERITLAEYMKESEAYLDQKEIEKLAVDLDNFSYEYDTYEYSMSGWKSIYNITNAQEYILIVLGGYLGCLFMQSLTMLVSAKTNSSVIAVIVPFILIFLPSFLSGTSLPLLNKILGLLPDQMLQMNQVVKFFNLYEIGGKVFCAVPILIISYSILLLLIVPVIYFIYRRKEVYN